MRTKNIFVFAALVILCGVAITLGIIAVVESQKKTTITVTTPAEPCIIENATVPDAVSNDESASTVVSSSSSSGSSVANPIDMGTFDVAVLGYGPAGHNYLYRATEIDANKNRRRRKYLAIEELPFKVGRCGKIDDVPVPHAKNLNSFSGATECKFDESCKVGNTDCDINDNYFTDVARSIRSVDNEQWNWGLAALRFIKNGDNEPSRCLINELQKPAYCSRFKPTTFGARGKEENNVNFAIPGSAAFNTSVNKEYNYRFDDPAWQQSDLDNLLCNAYCTDGCDDCGTTLDDYLVRYSIGLATVHPFTGVDCAVAGGCPVKVCHNYFTLMDYYSNIFGYVNATTGVVIPNMEAAMNLIDFNVGYYGDGFGGHEPCAYVEWNTIEYSTAGEFCYLPNGMSSVCRDMDSRTTSRASSLQATFTKRYNERVQSVNVVGNSIRIITVASSGSPVFRSYRLSKGNGELIFGMPPQAINALSGNVINAFKAASAPVITNPSTGTPRGGFKYLEQPKGANPLTINVILSKPFLAFSSEETTESNFHMSTRNVGSNAFHSRAEYYNNPMHRRTNVHRFVYSDYYMQNEWLSAFAAVERGDANITLLKTRLLSNLRMQYPYEASVQAMTEADILDVFYKQTMNGWSWQTPGNKNSPTQLVQWASKPNAGVSLLSGYDMCMISSSFALQRDGWVSAAFFMVSQCMQNITRYDNPSNSVSERQFWADKLYCGLRGTNLNDIDGNFEATNTSIALNNEFPRVVDAGSLTGFSFPDGDATYGTYNGVHISKSGSTYTYTPCSYDPAVRQCTTAAYTALPSATCSPKSAASPFV